MKVRLSWLPRRHPLPADGVVGVGEVGLQLARRLLARGDHQNFRGVAGEQTLVLLGRDAPWAEGAIWLGRDPKAPGLWMPTRMQPELDAALVSRKLRAEGLIGPVALLPEQGMAIPLAEARPIEVDRLQAWLRT